MAFQPAALHIDAEHVGNSIGNLASRLYPLHRSLTGEGNRHTLRILADHLPVALHEVPTGNRVLDWVVPQEWRIRDAFIQDANGNRIVDYQQSNLHIVNGSHGVRATMTWEALRPHVHSLPEQPDAVPYRTDFFTDGWGFCLPHRLVEQLDQQPAAQFEVIIDAEHVDGSLTYGEIHLPGQSLSQVVIYAHLCHPSLANDNLSGICIAAHLAQWLQQAKRHYSYRIVFAPATLGAIVWLAENESQLSMIKHGLILTLLGTRSPFTYKRSRQENAAVDRIAEYCLRDHCDASLRRFTPFGYDERQFCSPGFNLPFGCLMRSAPGEFSEYHTNADNLALLDSEALARSFRLCTQIMETMELDQTYVNLHPKAEPCLGKHGVYRAFGQRDDRGRFQEAMMWLLNLADGDCSLLEIAKRSDVPLNVLADAAATLAEHGLIRNQD